MEVKCEKCFIGERLMVKYYGDIKFSHVKILDDLDEKFLLHVEGEHLVCGLRRRWEGGGWRW